VSREPLVGRHHRPPTTLTNPVKNRLLQHNPPIPVVRETTIEPQGSTDLHDRAGGIADFAGQYSDPHGFFMPPMSISGSFDMIEFGCRVAG